VLCTPFNYTNHNKIHAGIPGTHSDSALHALIGGVVGAAGSIILALVSIVLAILKLKGTCYQRGTLY
jgi:hypothetical protein